MLVYKQDLAIQWFLRKSINSSCFKPLIWVVISVNSALRQVTGRKCRSATLRDFPQGHLDRWDPDSEQVTEAASDSFSLLQQQQFISLHLNLDMESPQFCWADGNCWCLLKGFSSSTQRRCPDSRVHFLPEVKYGFFRQVFHFPPIFPFLLSCSGTNTPPIKTEIGVPLVCFFPFPMVTPGETQQFPPAKLVVSFLSYIFSLVNWQRFSCRKSIYFGTAQ